MLKTTKKSPCPACSQYANRGLTVDAIIEIKGNILLIKRGNKPFKRMWALPGGFVGWDETVEEALIRETEEETSLKVESYKLVGIYSKPERHPQQVINIAYAVKVKGESKAGDDALEMRLFPEDKLPKKMAADHKEILGDYLKQKEKLFCYLP